MSFRPTVGRLGHVLADRQFVVPADGQPGPAHSGKLQAKHQILMHRWHAPQENIIQSL